MAKFIGTPIRGTEFASVSDEAISTKVSADTQPRIRIDAGGRITWGSGSAGGDTNLYRDSANTLITDDVFKATSGLITLTTNGAPSDALPNGAIAVDTTNHVFYYRSNNTWNQVTAEGGNASLTVSDTPPAGAEAGDLWFESDTGKTFVYYDSFWVEIGSSSTTALASSITGNAATATTLETARTISLTGDVSGSVSFNGSSNATISTTIQPNSVALGTDTTGNYVSSLVAGTGVTLSNNSGEGAAPTVAIGQAVSTSSSVQFAGIRNTDFSNFGSNTFTKATIGAGEIAIDNGTTDTPGLLMYHANNNNWGIDSSQINGSQSLRFVTNLNETDGTVRASIDASGNMVATTFRGTAAGSVLKDTMLDNSQVTVVSTTAGSTGSMVNFITYSYTPVSSSSYLIVHIHISKYTMAGTTDDSWFSQINVDGSEIAYGWQMVNDNGTGTSGRSGVLFPLTGRYTNSNTNAKTIGIAARRDSADDSISIDNSSTAIWLRITEVAR